MTALREAANEDEFAERAQALLDCTGKIMCLYMPGADTKIEMMVGRDTKAEIRFGGPVTQEAIMDVMAHLSFYKKYFPKTVEEPNCVSPESILTQLRAILAEDRAAREKPTEQLELQTEQ